MCECDVLTVMLELLDLYALIMIKTMSWCSENTTIMITTHDHDHDHDHDHESLNPSRGGGGAALMNAVPAVSTSDGHGQGLKSSPLSPPLTILGKGLGRGKALPCLHL